MFDCYRTGNKINFKDIECVFCNFDCEEGEKFRYYLSSRMWLMLEEEEIIEDIL